MLIKSMFVNIDYYHLLSYLEIKSNIFVRVCQIKL